MVTKITLQEAAVSALSRGGASDVSQAVGGCDDLLGVQLCHWLAAQPGGNTWAASKSRAALLLLAQVGRSKREKAGEDVIFNRCVSRALDEFYDQRCGGCGGVGHLMTGSIKACPKCDGTGLKHLSQGERARAIGVTPEMLAKVWGRRIDKLAERIGEGWGNLPYQLRRQLGK
jgi:hypothetical protein